MDDLIVRSASQGRFVDQVVAHAVRHLILSEARRRELVAEAVALHAVLCQELKINAVATGEALKAAQFLHNLISLGLEIVSVQNVAVAARALVEQSLAAIVELAKKRLQALANRMTVYLRDFLGQFELTDAAGTREYQLAYGRDLETLAALSGSAVLADLTRAMVSALTVQGVETPWAQVSAEGVLYEQCATHELLRALEDFLDRAEEELRVSKQHLPWKELCAEARFTALTRSTPAVSEMNIHWGMDTLLATLAITARLPGRGRRKTMLSWDAFAPHIARLETPEFRAQSLTLLQKYFGTRNPTPSAHALGILRELAGWAFDQLLAYAPRAESAQQATGWTERIHLKFETVAAGRALREYLLGEVETGDDDEKPAKVRLGELARIATVSGEETADALRSALVNDFDWSSVRTEPDLVKLGEVVLPELLARYMPLEARFVHHVVTAEDGWTEWSTAHQQVLIRRLLSAGKDAPWVSLSQKGKAVLEEIFAQATPTQARQLRKLWVGLKIWGSCRPTKEKSPRADLTRARKRR